MIIVVFGLPGSGKSYLAQRLAKMLNAGYINSDTIRKELFKQPSYSGQEKKSVYFEMLKKISDLEYRKEVVVDTTLSDIAIRPEFISKLKNIAKVYFVEITADESLIKQRLSAFRNDSDAGFNIYKKIKNTWLPFEEPHLVLQSTNENIEEMLDTACDYIFSKDMNDENIRLFNDQENFPTE
ncbi:MAG: AAA family ATPase [Ginsengibacter sp.]